MNRPLFFICFFLCVVFFAFVSVRAEGCVPQYSCVYEPEICPRAGIQVQRCVDGACAQPARVSSLSCTPGLCAEGCVYNAQCIPFGTRVAGQYCGYDKLLVVQKVPSTVCEESWECGGNVCSSGRCQNVSAVRAEEQGATSLTIRIVCKVSHLFDSARYQACLSGTPGAALAGLEGATPGLHQYTCHPYQLRGDVDDNGVLNATDLAILSRSYRTNFTADLCCFDVNEDFAIDVYDVGAFEQVLADERGVTVCPVFESYVSPFAPGNFTLEPLTFIPRNYTLTVPVLEPSVVTSTSVSFIVYNVTPATDEVRVYRSFAGSTNSSLITMLRWIDEGFVDQGLLSGVTYQYVVEARNSTTSLNSSVVSITPSLSSLFSSVPGLPAPTVAGVLNGTGVVLTW